MGQRWVLKVLGVLLQGLRQGFARAAHCGRWAVDVSSGFLMGRRWESDSAKSFHMDGGWTPYSEKSFPWRMLLETLFRKGLPWRLGGHLLLKKFKGFRSLGAGMLQDAMIASVAYAGVLFFADAGPCRATQEYLLPLYFGMHSFAVRRI